jgi:hypothetical protein
MPKGTEYKITWNETQKAYELDHTPFVFPLADDSLGAWLKMIDAFHLETASGHSLTARKETRQRGTAYWYAYKRVDGKLQKKYLGEASKITLTMLESVARSFVEVPEPEPVQKHQLPPCKPTLKFTNSLPGALSIFGFPALPTKAALIAKHRELVKRHHPDRGGLHEDMVAVNLAYDFLKRYVSR